MRIDWRNHLINFVLVVLSILLAFQLERCGSDAREDRLVAAHLAEIVDETRFNERQVAATLMHIERDLARIDTLLLLIRRGKDVGEINRLTLEAMNLSTLYLKQTAYNSFIASGDVRFLDDFDTKSEIISLYEYYRIAEAFGELLRQTYQNGFFDHIQEQLDLTTGQPQPLEVYTNRRFVNALSSIRYFLSRMVTMLERDRQRMKTFIEGYENE